MIAFIRRHISYANVTATLALVVALGGTSYAAFSLPRNSVGSAQIRNSSVRSTDIRNRTIRLTDLANSTRASLRGQQGVPGPQGPPGPAAVRYFAAVSANGQLVRGNATSSDHTNAGSGLYTIGFGASTSACAYSATLGTTDGNAAPAGRVTVRDDGGKVGVQTFDASGAAADLPFHLIVAC
ncbi:MAG: hypothetical protein JWO74_4321 [Solirubrobacterales bacterium]|nr:hypothetical protein [Solirubrobacterales bacterium]